MKTLRPTERGFPGRYILKLQRPVKEDETMSRKERKGGRTFEANHSLINAEVLGRVPEPLEVEAKSTEERVDRGSPGDVAVVHVKTVKDVAEAVEAH
jgi:hypothetical protein